MSNVQSKTKYNDSWMYILLLSTIVILAESLKTYNFSLFDVNITYVIFLLPLIYGITNYITTKYGFRKTILGIVISVVSLIAFILLMNFAIGKELDFSSITGGLIGYIISQLVNTLIYKFLIVNTNRPYFLILLNYIFAYIVFYMLYTVVHMNIIVAETFWIGYFVTIGIQTIMSIGLAFFTKKVKLGMSKDD